MMNRRRNGRAVRTREISRSLDDEAFSDFFEHAPVGLHLVGPDGVILQANQTELDLLGYRRDEYVGRHIADFHADGHAIASILARLAAGETLRDHAARLRAKDGSLKHVLITSNVRRGADGTFLHTRCFTRDVTDLERLSRDKDESVEHRGRLAAIIDTSDDAIVSKTLDGVIRTWNRGAEQMFGWTAQETIGRHITLIIPEERRAEEDEVLARIRRGELVDHFETIRVTKDGRRLNISLSVSPLKDGDGRVVGASKIARDVTERRRLEDERARLLERERQAREAAEASNRTKDQLLAVVSHELRTPLNAILGYARMLQDGGLDATATAHAVDVIIRNASAQSRLVEDLLDLSRIVTGRLAFSLEECALQTLVDEALDAIRPAAGAKGIEMVTTFGSDLAEVRCAPDRVRQVVWNLAMNAVKFTPAGGHIRVTVTRSPEHVVIAVADDGVGIGADVLPHVFEPFRQEDSTTTRAHGGLGLGLALVKHIVELHGGRVRAESPGKGRGSTFTVTLPVDRPAATNGAGPGLSA